MINPVVILLRPMWIQMAAAMDEDQHVNSIVEHLKELERRELKKYPADFRRWE